MNVLVYLFIAAAVGGAGFMLYRTVKARRNRLDSHYFSTQWKHIQSLCKDKSSWHDAITQADKLLNKALRKRRFKGKSMGERMVSAQRLISNNDSMWFAHNLAKKTVVDPSTRLRENDVKSALIGFRQSLKDLGALESSKPVVTPENEDSKS